MKPISDIQDLITKCREDSRIGYAPKTKENLRQAHKKLTAFKYSNGKSRKRRKKLLRQTISHINEAVWYLTEQPQNWGRTLATARDNIQSRLKSLKTSQS